MKKELSIPYRTSFHKWLNENLNCHRQTLYWATHNRFCGYAPIYDYYPLQFCRAFGIPVDGRLEKINLASQLCFKATLLKDQYIDKKEKGGDEDEMEAAAKILFLKSKEILQSVFTIESEFWYYWERRYSELRKAEESETRISERKFSYSSYRSLAASKVAIAKLAIDCNFVSTGCVDVETYISLLQSHKAFAVSMQLFDDLFDLPEDIENGQFNIALHFLKQKCILMGITFDKSKPEEMEKLLFLSGVAKRLLNLCLKEVAKAKLEAENVDAPLWKETLRSYEQMYRKILEGTDEYLSLIKAKAALNKKFKFTSVEELHILNNSQNSGLEFVLRQQNNDGTWFEYHTSAGLSNIWATGFVLTMTSDLLPEEVRKKSRRALVSNPGLLWGYRSSYVVDSDSSAFAILCGAGKGKMGSKSLNELLHRQNPDGGFSTYAKEDVQVLSNLMHLPDNSDYSGWTQSHPCVSAVVLFTLLKLNRKKDRMHIQNLETFLVDFLNSSRKITYWWTSEVYTVFWLLQCYKLGISDNLKRLSLKRYIQLIEKFNQISLDTSDGELDKPFYIAMLIKCGCELNNQIDFPEIKNITTGLVRKLLSLQYEDGSWEGADALQIPEPDCLEPESIPFPVSTQGCSVRAPEYNRLFSTSVAVNALHQFGKVYE
jgi:hypothetical protein